MWKIHPRIHLQLPVKTKLLEIWRHWTPLTYIYFIALNWTSKVCVIEKVSEPVNNVIFLLVLWEYYWFHGGLFYSVWTNNLRMRVNLLWFVSQIDVIAILLLLQSMQNSCQWKLYNLMIYIVFFFFGMSPDPRAAVPDFWRLEAGSKRTDFGWVRI